MIRYPETALKDSCNSLIDELRLKLEKKDFFAARQYLRTRHYRPASEAFKGFLRNWPNSIFREEALFNILQADHDLAVNSVESRQAERAEAGIRSFNTFADAFPESTRLPEARILLRDLTVLHTRTQRTSIP